MGDTKTLHVDPSNLEQSRAWDGDEGEFWAANWTAFDDAVAAYHQSLLAAAAIQPDFLVLDIGCGSGQTTRDAARIATSGRAVGVDLSSQMLQVARRLTEEEGLRNVVFEYADAQVHPFEPASFDVATSRTGTMFFGDPLAAFTNIARTLRPEGRLVMVAWQSPTENEWFMSLVTAMAQGRDLPAPPPDAPGPFTLADPRRVAPLLTAAGFVDHRFEDIHAPMYFGADASAGHHLLGDQTAWMREGLDDAAKQRALDDLYVSMKAHETPRGVLYASAMWLITATRRP